MVRVAGQGRLWQLLAYTEGSCGGRPLAVPVDRWWRGGMGACGVRMQAGVRVMPVVFVLVVTVLCAVDGARARGRESCAGCWVAWRRFTVGRTGV